MAQHKSAEKRARQSEKRRARNRSVLSRTRSAVKRLRDAIDAGDAAAAGQRLHDAERALRKAASQGVVPRRRADRSVSRLARAVGKLAR